MEYFLVFRHLLAAGIALKGHDKAVPAVVFDVNDLADLWVEVRLAIIASEKPRKNPRKKNSKKNQKILPFLGAWDSLSVFYPRLGG